MNEEADQGEKTEEPSEHRLEEFRRKGQVASSKELTNVLILAFSVLALVLIFTYIYEVLHEFMVWVYVLDADSAFHEKVLAQIFQKGVIATAKCVAPIFLIVILVAVGSSILQFGLLFAPEVLEWKLDRINPLSGIKRLFSTKSLFEAIKGIFKFIIVLGISYLFIRDDLKTYMGFLQLDFVTSFFHGKSIVESLCFSIIGGLLVIAMSDFAFQKFDYRKKLMMTKEQVKKEYKEKEGNPEIKQKIKAIQKEMARRRMISDVPKADVIVTNPTHISVALKYDPNSMIAPKVIAKGADLVALNIRKIAKEHNIPMVENVPLARSLYKTVKIGQMVPREMYKAISEVLAFVYRLKARKSKLQKLG